MTEYEVIVERMNPCGGAEHGKKEFMDVATDDPERYVRDNGQFPILEVNRNERNELVITTGDGKGYFTKYYFTE